MKGLFIFLLCICGYSSFAQRWEFGLGAGSSNYIGDLSQGINSNNFGMSFGLGVKRNIDPHFGFRLDAMIHNVSAADSLSTDKEMFRRNLSFQSRIYEAALTFEINFFKFIPGKVGYRFTPYINFGIGFFHFNPQTRYKGQLIDLQPVGTEGQYYNPVSKEDTRYSLNAWSLPFAGGLKWNFAGNSSIALEAGMRLTTTDYIDDVSGVYANPTQLKQFGGQVAVDLADRTRELPRVLGYEPNQVGKMRGDAGYNDIYWYLGLRYTYTISQGVCPAFK
jgi:hypothetical protein